MQTRTYEQKVPIWNGEKVEVNKMTQIITTDTTVPKLGVMLVGLGGNNGSTFTAGILANKKNVSWVSKTGTHQPNFFGSFT